MSLPRNVAGPICFLLTMGALAGALAAQEDSILSQGTTVSLGSRKAAVTRLDTLPYVQSEYTRRFNFDTFENPKLHELRQRYALDAVVAPGKGEFDRQILLMDWAHRQFRKFGRPTAHPRGALEILQGISQGETFYCAHYAKLLVSAAASLGWVDRELALRRHQGVAMGGSTEHSTTEIWSNEHRKWVMLDPTSNMYLEKAGVPLNAFEIREEWFYKGGADLVFVIGRDRQRYRKSDLPVLLARFADFGDLAVNPDELDKYGFIGYIPNTNLMDAGEDYGQMFIVKDKLCEGTRWHQRTLPANPAIDPYFPVGQAALVLRAEGDVIRVEISTFTPNFERYEIQIDGGAWEAAADPFLWRLHAGENRICAVTVNRFGVRGPIASAVVEVTE